MKKFIYILICTLFIWTGLIGTEPYFLSHPTLTPDGKQIIFSYDNDLWMVKSSGGTALRLTAMEGRETQPRVSPDSRWLAFSSTQNRNADVYIMPLKGGEITQLTFHESGDFVDSWSWDSKTIYFNSSRYNSFSEYQTDFKGGTPKRLFGNYFNTIHGMVVHPVTQRYYFTDTWESLRFANRKGYRGDYNPDIKSYYPPTQNFKVHTTFKGKDFSPVIDQEGNIYFVSDEQTGEFNLFRLDGAKKIPLTRFSTSLRNPQVAALGTLIVFEKDYQIFLYNVAKKSSKKVNINLHANNYLKVSQDFNIKGKITAFNVSPDNKKMALVSRGQLFVSDIKGQFIRQLDTGPERVMEVHWLADNTTVIFNQTSRGYLNWYKISAQGKGAKTALTKDQSNNRSLSFNQKKTKAAYYSGRNQVRLMDLKTFKTSLLLEDELWGFGNSPAQFSLDDRYLVFTVFRNFEEDILIYDFETKRTVNITNSGVSETQPCWSGDGRYLYFTADRFKARFPRSGENSNIYRLALQKLDLNFRSKKYDGLFKKEKKNKDKKEKKETPKKVKVTINFEEMLDRWEVISPQAGNQYSPYVISKEDETILLFSSSHEGDKYHIYKKTFYPFKKSKVEKIQSPPSRGMDIRQAKDNHYLLINGIVYTLNLKTSKTKAINISHSFAKNLQAEFNQMFFETWANLQENFYDHDFHGRDWQKIRNQYATYLPYLNSRADLRQLISDMLGELNSSHLGFNSSGEEEKTYYSQRSLETGIIFKESDPYVVDYILRRSPAQAEHVHIKPNDRLIAVNGQKVDPKLNRNIYFSSPFMAEEIKLTFQRDEGMIFKTRIHPQCSRALKTQLYDHWQDINQNRVDEWSGKKIAYVHMKNMGSRELQKFMIDMTTEWYQRKALILDLRYNTGGNVHDDVLHFLIQKPYLKWKYRGGKYGPQPNFAPAGKPIVVLINEQSLSDAEMTSAGFKALKLGTIIGTETYRWIIFTTGKGLVDGSYYRMPCWGCFTLDGKNLEKTGVTPDIYLKNTFKDRILSNDPQLKKAVEEILKNLK